MSSQYSGFNPDELGIGVFDTEKGSGVINYPRYALIADGIFTNIIADEASIEGMKYWTSPAQRLAGYTHAARSDVLCVPVPCQRDGSSRARRSKLPRMPSPA